MKILAVSDVLSNKYYRYYRKGVLNDIDLILSCGDLKPEYLEFLVTMAGCPLVYVHGNHDDRNEREPQGCICADGRLVDVNGLRILGLGGSYRYRDGEYMYSEKEMKNRIRRLWLPIKKHRGFDILLTHAPAQGINDLDDLPHKGFACFRNLIEQYEPTYFVHGHIHRNYGVRVPQKTETDHTTVINAFDYCMIDL
ncbi:MAG: metallophosphoesterase family protein [Clostridia bacterium]|nr:metallophosphoesterase family protein [Clostridia bacterium]